MEETGKVVKIQVGTGENASIVELVNNDKKIAELREEFNSTIETMQATIGTLLSRIAELEEKMNAIDVEPSESGNSGSTSSGI